MARTGASFGEISIGVRARTHDAVLHSLTEREAACWRKVQAHLVANPGCPVTRALAAVGEHAPLYYAAKKKAEASSGEALHPKASFSKADMIRPGDTILRRAEAGERPPSFHAGPPMPARPAIAGLAEPPAPLGELAPCLAPPPRKPPRGAVEGLVDAVVRMREEDAAQAARARKADESAFAEALAAQAAKATPEPPAENEHHNQGDDAVASEEDEGPLPEAGELEESLEGALEAEAVEAVAEPEAGLASPLRIIVIQGGSLAERLEALEVVLEGA